MVAYNSKMNFHVKILKTLLDVDCQIEMLLNRNYAAMHDFGCSYIEAKESLETLDCE